MRCLLVLLALAAALASVASGQAATGALYGVVTDRDSKPLACVTITLHGTQGRPQTQITNARGEFRFPALFPGIYQGKVDRAGFSTSEYADIPVHLGGTTTIHVKLLPADDDAVTLTAECPLVDERRIHAGVTITRDELEKVPAARNPWTLLRQAPGVLLDRVDVGGSEGAHPLVARAPAVASEQNVFAIEGVPITDPHTLAASPTFSDFESLEEVQVTTGGTEASVATAGVVLNLVTRRGTNHWRFSARSFHADDDWQPSPHPPDLGMGQAAFVRSPRVHEVDEHAADAGGPLLRDRLWAWSGWSRASVDMILAEPPTPFDQGAGDRQATNAALKLDLAAGARAEVHAYAHRSDLELDTAGSGPLRAASAAWDVDAPTGIYKLESTHVLGPRFHLGARLARVESETDLRPRGGDALPARDAGGVFSGGSLAVASDRDHRRIDASAFWGAGAVGHELRVGAADRDVAVTTAAAWGAHSSVHVAAATSAGTPALLLFHPERSDVELDVHSAWVQDTLSLGDLAADVGVRWDRQSGERVATLLPANPVRPDLLPAAALPGADAGVEWETLVPRIGLTWVMGDERATLLRASYSRFADQLGSALFSDLADASATAASRFVEVRFADLDGDGVPDRAEPHTVRAEARPVTLVDRSLDSPRTDEVLVAAEHSGVGCYSIGGRLTWRRYRDVIDERALVRDAAGLLRAAAGSDYVAGPALTGRLPDDARYEVPTFTLRPGLEPIAGRWLANGSREVEYEGATLWVERRLRARWQLRGFVNLRDEQWNVPDEFRAIDDPNHAAGGQDDDGAPFAPGSVFPDKSDVRLHAEWDYSVAGLYRARAGFAAGILAHGRQGYPLLYTESLLGADGVERTVAVSDGAEPLRLDDVHQLDVRLEKEIRLRRGGLTLSADAFNLLNRTAVLQRGTELDAPTADFAREIVSPRIVRLGLRLQLR